MVKRRLFEYSAAFLHACRSVAASCAVAVVLFFGCNNPGYPNPQGGVVAAGSATITAPNASTVQINQSTSKAVINWQSYNVAGHETVNYQQPNASSIALNRINPASGPSSIYGKITANGQVWLMNPAGIYFGPGAYVNVAGMLATTATISDANFMAGIYKFYQQAGWNGSIINEGMIYVAQAGLLALIGNGVVNAGYIEANLGTVVLGTGSEYTVNFSGNDMISFALDNEQIMSAPVDQHNKPLKAMIENSGEIMANGGKVLITSQAASDVLDNAINMSGVVQANTVDTNSGEIVLNGGEGTVEITGTMLAKGEKAGGKGGTVTVEGKQVALKNNAHIDVSGDQGGGDVYIGGGYQGNDTAIQNAAHTYVGTDAAIYADALTAGNGGQIIIWSDGNTQFYGKLFARGGELSGNGGLVETSGKQYLDARGFVSTAAANGVAGIWLLDPADITISAGADANYTDIASTFTPDSGAATSTINTTTLGTALATNNIIITTTNNGVDGGSVGNITVSSPISWASGNSLTLTAANNIAINAGITIGNSALAQLVLNAAGSVTQTAAIGGSGALVQQGAGTLTLSQTNTYSGGTSILGGTVNVATLPSAAGNSTIGTGNLTINGGVINYTGTNVNFNRAITVGASGGTIRVTNTIARTLTLSGGIANAGILTFDTTGTAPANITVSTLGISGTGGVTKEGAGTLTLGIANTFTGATQINAGLASLSNANALGSGATQSSSITVASGARLNTGFNGTLGNTNSITISGIGAGGLGALTSSTNSGTLTNAITLAGNTSIGGASGLILNGVINDGGSGYSLTKLGVGTTTLGGSNTFTGATLVSAGTLSLSNADGLGSGATQSSSITVSSGAALNMGFATNTLGNTNTINLAGTGVSAAGALRATTSTDTLSNAIVLTDNASIGSTGTMILNGIISDGGSGYSLTKVGTGVITLNGVNTYSGGTSITAGTLGVTNKNALGTTGSLALSGSGILRINLGGDTLQNSSVISMAGTSDITGITAAGLTDILNNDITMAGTHSITSTTATANLSLTGSITNSASNLTFTGSGNIQVSGVIGSGAGGLVKSGAGTLTLSNANTYTGNTSVTAGTLAITNINALGTAGDISVSASTLNMNFGGATFANTNTMTLTGAALLTSSTAGGNTDTINNPIILASTGTKTITSTNAGALFVLGNSITNNTALLTITGAGDTTVNGVIGSDTGALTKSGTGILTLNSAGTYTGATTISAGTLRYGVVNAIGSSSAVNLSVSGANLDLNGYDGVIGSLAGVAGTTVTMGTGSLTAGSNNTTTTYTGIISGSGGLTKEGTGTMTLAGANTFTGATLINDGALSLSNVNALGSMATQSSSINVISGARMNTAFNGTFGNTNTLSIAGDGVGGLGALTSSTNSGTLTNAITLTSNTSLGGANGLILNGVISDGGNSYSLTKVGTGTTTLGGSNIFTGATLVNAGTLSLSNVNGLGSGATQSSSITVVSGAALNMGFTTNTLGNTNTISLAGTGISSAGSLTGSTSTDTLSNAIILTDHASIGGTGTMILDGVISDGGNSYSLTKAGAGTITLTAANTYSGGTSITAGTLGVTNTNALGTTGSLALSGSGILRINLAGDTLQNTSTISMAGTSDITAITGAGLTDTLSNDITMTGTHSITSTTATANLHLNGNITNSASDLTFTGSGNIQVLGSIGGGTGGLVKSGAGTLTLANANTYSGGTSVNAGTLLVTDANALGTTGTVAIATASTLSLNIGTATLANSDTLTMAGTASLINASTSGTTTFNNAIVQSAAGTKVISTTNAGAVFLLTGGITNTTALLSFTGAGDTTVNGVIGGDVGGLTKSGTGTLTLAGANTYTGITTISAGILSTGLLADGGVASGIGASTNAATNLVMSGGRLEYTGSTTTIDRNYTLTAATTNTIGITNTGTNLIISGVSTATSGALTKAGAGTLTLSGNNLYTGLTTVSEGTLAAGIDNALATGGLTVNGGIYAIGTHTDSLGAVTLIDGSITGSTGVLTGSSYGVQNGSISAILAGSGILTKSTSGIVTLSGLNTYTGATRINAGTLSVSMLDDGGLPSNIGASTTTAANLTLGGGTLQYTGASATINRNYVLTTATSSGIEITSAGTNLTFSGASTNTTGALTKSGAGTLTFSGANLYTGLTTVSEGTLAAGVNNALSSGALTVSGGIYDIGTFTDTVGAVTLSSGEIAGSTGTLTGTSYSVESGLISGRLAGAAALTKSTTGTVIVSSANTYSGDTTINDGILSLTNASALSASTDVIVASGGTIDLNFDNTSLANSNALTLNGDGVGGIGALTLSGSTITLNNTVSIASASTIGGAGTGTMVFAGAMTGAANLNIELANAGVSLPIITLSGGGNLSVNTGGAINQTGILTVAGTSSFNAGAHAISLGLNNALSGVVSLTNSGANDINLNNSIALSLGTSSAGNKLTAISSGVITLSGNVTANATGDSIVLSGAGFDNAGMHALDPGANGRYLVWSSNANPFSGGSPDNRGGLAYDFKQYSATYGVSPVLGSGDGFLYTLAPSITPSLTGSVSKTYDGNNTATLTSANYTSTGAVDGDTVTLNNPASGTYASVNANTGISVTVNGVAIASATNGSATVYGYDLSPTTVNAAIGEITPATLTYESDLATRVYGALNPVLTGTVTGFVNGETTATATTGVLNFTTPALITSDVGQYAIDGSGLTANFGNYVFTQAAGNASALTITPATLTVSGVMANNKVYDANTAATLNLNNAVLSGVLFTDSVSIDPASYLANFVTANVGDNIPVNVSGLDLSGSKAMNYTLTQPTGLAANITPAPVPPVPDNGSTIPYQLIFPTEFTAPIQKVIAPEPADLQLNASAGCLNVSSDIAICRVQ